MRRRRTRNPPRESPFLWADWSRRDSTTSRRLLRPTNREVAVSDALDTTDTLTDALEDLARVRPLILLNRFDAAVDAARARIRRMPADNRPLDREVVAGVVRERLAEAARLIEAIPERERHAVERAFLTELSLLAGFFAADVRGRWPDEIAACP